MAVIGGHGHVTPRPDGARARCGGPGLCNECSREQAIQQPRPATELLLVRHGPGAGFPYVAGRCPACHVQALFLAVGNRVTCASLSCPNPCAADDYLDPAVTP